MTMQDIGDLESQTNKRMDAGAGVGFALAESLIRLFAALFVVGKLSRHRLQQIQRLDDAIPPEAYLVPKHKRAVA
jgi:hypothetical protein